MDHEEKLRWCQQYIDALEEERRKIQAFHRELPLSMQIVNEAIETCRQQMEVDVSFLRRSNHEGTLNGGHMSEELIPIQWSLNTEEDKNTWGDREVDKMHDLFGSLQLNQHPELPTKEQPRAKKSSGKFHPLCMEKPSTTVTAGSTPGADSNREEAKGESSHKKVRRCWSSKLHSRFVDALHKLGGPYVATPKQIRELMKVDGLTNDEVKSHLQKYRLHIRQPTPSIQRNSNGIPQFVIMGGLWGPPPEYAKAMITQHKVTKICCPLAAIPQAVHYSQNQQHKENQQSPNSTLNLER